MISKHDRKGLIHIIHIKIRFPIRFVERFEFGLLDVDGQPAVFVYLNE